MRKQASLCRISEEHQVSSRRQSTERSSISPQPPSRWWPSLYFMNQARQRHSAAPGQQWRVVYSAGTRFCRRFFFSLSARSDLLGWCSYRRRVNASPWPPTERLTSTEIGGGTAPRLAHWWQGPVQGPGSVNPIQGGVCRRDIRGVWPFREARPCAQVPARLDQAATLAVNRVGCGKRRAVLCRGSRPPQPVYDVRSSVLGCLLGQVDANNVPAESTGGAKQNTWTCA